MGLEFVHLFDEWSGYYDDTVGGQDEEYREVFQDYESILNKVVERTHGSIMEFGVGTGNLTTRLLQAGRQVLGVEPSASMREKANEKLGGQVLIVDGDFLHFPIDKKVDSYVSTYAFHHINDEEKQKAIVCYSKLLKSGGKIVFADTMYPSKEAHQQAILKARQEGFFNLSSDLSTEYYSTIPFLQKVFELNGFKVSFERCNPFVWLVDAEKI